MTLITVFVILLMLLLGSVFTTQLLVDVHDQSAASEHRRFESYLLADVEPMYTSTSTSMSKASTP